MTEGYATKTPTRVVAALPPYAIHFVGLFAALRLADIATTRAVISAGGIELNPFLVSASGSALDLLAVQTPFCLLLLAAVLLAAAYCENLVGGSARWIYAPVVLLYCVPAVHNLAVFLRC